MFNSKKYKLNDKDNYYAYLRRDEIKSSVMRYVAIAVIACCICVDFLNIGQLMQLAMDTPSSVIANPMSNLFEFLKPYLLTGMITAVIAFCALFIGICFRKIQSSPNNKLYLSLIIVAGVFLIIFACAVTYFRFTSEIKQAAGGIDTLSYDPFALSLLYTTIMFIGIMISLIFGFFGRDIDREAFRKSEEQEFKHDKAKYKSSIQTLLKDKLQSSGYDSKLNKYIQDSSDVFKQIELIVSQIKCIEDPAEIQAVTDAFGSAQSK